MPSPRKPKAGSTALAVKAMMDAAQEPLMPPAHVKLRKADMPFWHGILRARARDEWTETDLVIAAQLARCQNDIQHETQALEREEPFMTAVNGIVYPNPRIGLRDRLMRQQMAMMRTLRMGGKPAGDPRSEAGRRRIERESRALREDLTKHELLAS